MNNIKPSLALAIAGWTYVFAAGWFMLVGVILSTVLTWVLFIIFFMVALVASSVYYKGKQ